MASSLTVSAGRSKATSVDAPVSEQIARRYAKARIEKSSQKDHFSSFQSATLGEPELFYITLSEEYKPGTWVYPIEKDGREIGHIVAGAQWELPRIIRLSTSISPHHRVASVQQNLKNPDVQINDQSRFVYDYPFTFGVEIQSKSATETKRLVDLKTGSVQRLTSSIGAVYDIESDNAQSTSQVDPGSVYTPTSTGSIESDVPNWDGYECGSDWIGCLPVSCGMCLGTHDSIDEKCDVMETLNEEGDVDDDGYGWPVTVWPMDRNDIQDGISAYDSSYDTSALQFRRRSTIMSEINSGRPCVVGWMDDDKKDPDSVTSDSLNDWMPSGHAETIFAYEEEGGGWFRTGDLYIDTYDTYGDVNQLFLDSTTELYYVITIEP